MIEKENFSSEAESVRKEAKIKEILLLAEFIALGHDNETLLNNDRYHAALEFYKLRSCNKEIRYLNPKTGDYNFDLEETDSERSLELRGELRNSLKIFRIFKSLLYFALSKHLELKNSDMSKLAEAESIFQRMLLDQGFVDGDSYKISEDRKTKLQSYLEEFEDQNPEIRVKLKTEAEIESRKMQDSAKLIKESVDRTTQEVIQRAEEKPIP